MKLIHKVHPQQPFDLHADHAQALFDLQQSINETRTRLGLPSVSIIEKYSPPVPRRGVADTVWRASGPGFSQDTGAYIPMASITAFCRGCSASDRFAPTNPETIAFRHNDNCSGGEAERAPGQTQKDYRELLKKYPKPQIEAPKTPIEIFREKLRGGA